MSEPRAERHLTISTLHELSAPHYINGPCSVRLVPYVRMRGAWLEAAGFRCGERLRVEVERDRLVLTPVESGAAQ